MQIAFAVRLPLPRGRAGLCHSYRPSARNGWLHAHAHAPWRGTRRIEIELLSCAFWILSIFDIALLGEHRSPCPKSAARRLPALSALFSTSSATCVVPPNAPPLSTPRRQGAACRESLPTNAIFASDTEYTPLVWRLCLSRARVCPAPSFDPLPGKLSYYETVDGISKLTADTPTPPLVAYAADRDATGLWRGISPSNPSLAQVLVSSILVSS